MIAPRLPIALALLVACSAADEPGEAVEAQPLNGQSALLAGMHDIESSAFMRTWTSAADKGWITDLHYIGATGTPPSIDCHATETSAGVSIIQRLDLDGAHSFPTGDPTGYATAFAAYATACAQIHVWIVGNEPNATTHDANPATYAASYAAAYVAVRNRVHAVAGHANDLVLATPASPFSPYCICSMRRIIQEIVARGVQPDGFAIHAYTRAANASQFGSLVNFIGSEQMDTYADGCGYTFHSHFRIYRDWIAAIEAEGQAGKPVFMTEAGNACLETAGNKCYPDTNLGYFQAMYAEIRTWNTSHATKIKAITPYRWTANDDGTGRDFAVGATARTGLRTDLVAAFAAQPPATCDNNVPLNGTACNPGDPGAQFVCTNPGAPSAQQWTRQACSTGQACSGNHCQGGPPPATCDNGIPFNGTACNPSDPFAQFLCTNPGAPSAQQWTRQSCAASQACSGTHCNGGPPLCGTGLFCAGNQIAGAAACVAGSQTIYCCAPGHTIVNGACS